jgi:hypothetical protein
MLSLFRRTPVISGPTIGFLDLTEGEAAIELAADRAAISPLFRSSEDSSLEPPRCNVLFLYCHIEPDGSIRCYSRSVREVIRDSGAVVVAAENSAESYIAGTKKHDTDTLISLWRSTGGATFSQNSFSGSSPR